eukprot:4397055-Prymnesium_polylepis.3
MDICMWDVWVICVCGISGWLLAVSGGGGGGWWWWLVVVVGGGGWWLVVGGWWLWLVVVVVGGGWWWCVCVPSRGAGLRPATRRSGQPTRPTGLPPTTPVGLCDATPREHARCEAHPNCRMHWRARKVSVSAWSMHCETMNVCSASGRRCVRQPTVECSAASSVWYSSSCERAGRGLCPLSRSRARTSARCSGGGARAHVRHLLLDGLDEAGVLARGHGAAQLVVYHLDDLWQRRLSRVVARLEVRPIHRIDRLSEGRRLEPHRRALRGPPSARARGGGHSGGRGGGGGRGAVLRVELGA